MKRNKITIDSLKDNIIDSTESLLSLAKESTFNSYSENIKYILSKGNFNKEEFADFNEQNNYSKRINDLKTSTSIEIVIGSLKEIFFDLYEIDIYIYKAKRSITIVEIEYFLKSELDSEYQKEIINDEPMLHCKIPIPIYCSDNKRKFDINWRHRTLNHLWRLFWWRNIQRIKY